MDEKKDQFCSYLLTPQLLDGQKNIRIEEAFLPAHGKRCKCSKTGRALLSSTTILS